MHVMTRRGWQPLIVHTENHIWERVSYNYLSKVYEHDDNGTLLYVDTLETELPEAPPAYRGPLPSLEALAYIRRIQREVNESREMRGLEPLVFD